MNTKMEKVMGLIKDREKLSNKIANLKIKASNLEKLKGYGAKISVNPSTDTLESVYMVAEGDELMSIIDFMVDRITTEAARISLEIDKIDAIFEGIEI